MTRINCGIPARELTKKHLLAEHREIKRIPNMIARGRYSLEGMPCTFKLGEGHVKFFYDKLLYLKNRYEELYATCVENNYNVSYYGSAWDNVPGELMNDYFPTENDRTIVRARIAERLAKMKI